MCCVHAVPAGWVMSHHPLCLSVMQVSSFWLVALLHLQSTVCVCCHEEEDNGS